MRYGHFDPEKREYVIDRVDVPVSWTNYLGVEELCGVVNHTAGGYLFYRSPEHHRVTRFRPNGVPMGPPRPLHLPPGRGNGGVLVGLLAALRRGPVLLPLPPRSQLLGVPV